jgi:hypothetical protein
MKAWTELTADLEMSKQKYKLQFGFLLLGAVQGSGKAR